MSENKTNTPQASNKIAKKSSFNTLLIAGLALFLVVAIAGSVFYTMNQKTSKSQASSSSSAVSKVTPKLCKVGGVNRPCPKPSRAPTRRTIDSNNIKPEINPYTGEKQ